MSRTQDATILLVDDTPANLAVLTELLEPQGYSISAAPSGMLATHVAPRLQPDLVLLDILMPEMDGIETCRRLKANPETRDIPIIFITASEDSQSMVEGFRAGGVDYIVKPFHSEEVLSRVQNHLRISQLHRQLNQKNTDLTRINEELKDEMNRRRETEEALRTADAKLTLLGDDESRRWGIEGFVGKSKTIAKILNDVRRLQNFSSVNVLITGESGTGKELVARALHFGSGREKGPFIPVNCVAIPEELVESMFFGHVRGAFTGATVDRKGYFELADGGTLFLDEIGDMPASLQAKLLRVLEDGVVTPVGGAQSRRVNVRVVAATNANFTDAIPAGRFRHDLYFRLAQYTVEVPPLRQRREDIPLLAEHFLKLFAAEMGLKSPPLLAKTIESLSRHDFPGNIRELKNLIERALIESNGEEIRPEHLHLSNITLAVASTSSSAVRRMAELEPAVAVLDSDLPLNLEQAENILIQRALAETRGNIAQAARLLGVNRARIYRKFGEGVPAEKE